ncbi:MAG: hypothetical protein IPM92_02675 [Saprospiraceae bacterium]|nr:hypothetical protein [Saprospiraceae bacterium]
MPKKYIYTRNKVCKKGKLDGRGWRWKLWPFTKEEFPVQPEDNRQDPALYEMELMKAGDDWLSDLATEWSSQDKKLKPLYCDAFIKAQACAMNLETEKAEFDSAKKEYDEALEEFEDLQAPAFSKTGEYILIALLAVAEFYFNYMIFSVMGSSKVETMISAATISIALPVSAFAFGHTVRIDNKTQTQRIWATFLVLVPFIVFVVISFLREALFEVAWRDSALKLSITPFQATLAFVFINLLIWLIAAFVSYRAAHKDPEKFRTLKLRYLGAKKVMEKFGSDYATAVKEYELARLHYEKIKHLRKEEFDHHVSIGRDMIKVVKWLISVYRNKNQEVRRSQTIPACFQKSIQELIMPAGLWEKDLDWNCDIIPNNQPLPKPSDN